MKNTYFVIAMVNDINYLVKVETHSALSAEHMILDLSYIGKHTYGVTAALAYNEKAMKTDAFVYSALGANPVSLEELTHIIEVRNEEIRKADEKENRINELKKNIKAMSEELNELLK